jgi:hypothetical protein
MQKANTSPLMTYTGMLKTSVNIIPCEQQVLIELAINSGGFW